MIAVVGEALVDLVVSDVPASPGLSCQALAGGSPFNVAVAAARLGAPTQLYSHVGRDTFGRLLADTARDNGVDIAGLAQDLRWTGLALTSLDEHGAASYEFRLDDGLGWSPSSLGQARQAPIVHFGSIASWLPSGEMIRQALSSATGLVTYDPNVRPSLMTSRAEAREIIEGNVGICDVVKASDEDLAWLYPGDPLDVVAERWLRGRPGLLVVTAGARGATVYRAEGPPIRRPAFAVDVVDTVGAGDAGMAALIVGLHDRAVLSGDAVLGMTETELTTLLDESILAAAITCSRRGADPPTADEMNGEWKRGRQASG